MKTNWSRSSKLLLACLVLLSAVAMPAAAVSVGEKSVPSDAEVGSQVQATTTLNQLYKDPQLESWTLQGETALTDVTWTVTYYDQTGSKIGQQSFDGQNMSAAVKAKQDVSEVKVKVTGTTPKVENFSYDPAQNFTVMALTQARDGGSSNAIESWTADFHTEESQSARQKLDSAQSAVQSSNSEKARETFDNAVSAYNNENWDLAEKLANDAESQANDAKQSSQTMQLAMYAVGGLVVIAVLAGGFLWYRGQQETYDKLG